MESVLLYTLFSNLKALFVIDILINYTNIKKALSISKYKNTLYII